MLRSLPSRLILSPFTLDVAVLVGLALVAGQGSPRYLTTQLQHLTQALSGHPVIAVEKQLDSGSSTAIGTADTRVFRRW